jgi:hypothetical protein
VAATDTMSWTTHDLKDIIKCLICRFGLPARYGCGQSPAS